MDYAPIEDATAEQSPDIDCCTRYTRTCDCWTFGPCVEETFVGCFMSIWECVVAAFEGCGECLAGCCQ